MIKIVDKLLHAGEGRRLKVLGEQTTRVGELEETVTGLSDEQIRGKTAELRQRHANGELLDDEFTAEETHAGDNGRVVKTKQFALKPMSVNEATLQMELVGHDFFVFTNAESNRTNVVYRRNDGHYGLIEPAEN